MELTQKQIKDIEELTNTNYLGVMCFGDYNKYHIFKYIGGQIRINAVTYLQESISFITHKGYNPMSIKTEWLLPLAKILNGDK